MKKIHKNKNTKYGKRSERKKINIIGVQEKQKPNNGTELVFRRTIYENFPKIKEGMILHVEVLHVLAKIYFEVYSSKNTGFFKMFIYFKRERG